MAGEIEVEGRNAAALFTLKIRRGDGMSLLAMNWRHGTPPDDFVGFAIEYREPKGDRFFALKNRLAFEPLTGPVKPNTLSTRLSPIQKFRWVHFPRNADLAGPFAYRVTPVFMNTQDELSYGEPQEAAIELRRETYPGKVNVAFTRGFVSSQAFVDRYESAGPISKLIPSSAKNGLTFKPTHPKTAEALAWMGFEARRAILDVLDRAIKDKDAQVRVIAYDLNEPEVVSRLEKLRGRLKVIIDNDGDHGAADSAEAEAAKRLAKSAGAMNVKRQHMGKLQHNKTIVVDSPTLQLAVCGSTNFSWRGFYVQSNNAVVLTGRDAIKPFQTAFDAYWQNVDDDVAAFAATDSAQVIALELTGIKARAGFSPYSSKRAQLKKIADDIEKKTTSSLFYSLAFLYQTPGPILEAIKSVTKDDHTFVYGVSDSKVGGLDIQLPDGKVKPVSPAALGKNVPEPFKSEPKGGSGIRMHHKFVVVDFDKPTARVYLGSYNFSMAADTTNGENLLLIRNKRIAVSYMIEALRIFDHYHFRMLDENATEKSKPLVLKKPPRKPSEKPWWREDYADAVRIRDRELFA